MKVIWYLHLSCMISAWLATNIYIIISYVLWIDGAFPKELGEDFDPEAGFQVVPLTECPHVTELPAWEISMKARCSVCKEDEVWICGTCGQILCSRYKNQHMLAHAQEQDHSVGLSFSDLSFWCFKCNAYLDVFAIPELHSLYRAAHVAKFGDQPCLPSPVSEAGAGAASSSG